LDSFIIKVAIPNKYHRGRYKITVTTKLTTKSIKAKNTKTIIRNRSDIVKTKWHFDSELIAA